MATRPGKHKPLDSNDPTKAISSEMERVKANVLAMIGYPSLLIKKHRGHVKARHPGVVKNTAQLKTLLMFSNPWLVRGKLMAVMVRTASKIEAG